MQMPLLNNRYGLVSQIGRGGMGVVYKAVDTFLGNRYVAVKEMSQRSLSPHEATYAIEAFKREALMLATLAHQNLPRIYDHFNQGRSSYLVMDFIDGYTLDELMQQTHDQKLPMDLVLLIAEQLSSVFGYLHSRQPPIIFRDIKPANVMITQEKDHIYLIDFGIARFFKPGQLRDTLFRYQGFQRVLRSLAWSNGLNTTLLATACEDCQLYSWDTISDDVPLLFKGHSLEVTHVAWSPDDRFLLSTGRDKTVKIWDVTTTSTILTYRGHTREVYTAAWSPDGSRIASAGADKTVHVWNASTGDLLLTYKEHTKEVHSLAWSPDGLRIASAGEDKLVRVWYAI